MADRPPQVNPTSIGTEKLRRKSAAAAYFSAKPRPDSLISTAAGGQCALGPSRTRNVCNRDQPRPELESEREHPDGAPAARRADPPAFPGTGRGAAGADPADRGAVGGAGPPVGPAGRRAHLRAAPRRPPDRPRTAGQGPRG